MDIRKIYEIPIADVTFFQLDSVKNTSGGNGIQLPDHEW